MRVWKDVHLLVAIVREAIGDGVLDRARGNWSALTRQRSECIAHDFASRLAQLLPPRPMTLGIGPEARRRILDRATTRGGASGSSSAENSATTADQARSDRP